MIFKIFPGIDAMAEETAKLISAIACRAVNQNGRFSIALSGGKTPVKIYKSLSAPEISRHIPWGKTHIFWGDERCVPLNSSDSNYKTAYDGLLSKAPVPEANLHPMPADGCPENAAKRYKKTLQHFFKIPSSSCLFPEFDLILLGMGEDGHTASIFPGTPADKEKYLWVLPSKAPEEYTVRDRLTITFPVINSAKNVIVLVSGSGKKDFLKSVSSESPEALKFPAGRIKPAGSLYWFVDRSSMEEA